MSVTQQQAEEMKEEAMARAREKQEFRQKNRAAASMCICTVKKTYHHRALYFSALLRLSVR